MSTFAELAQQQAEIGQNIQKVIRNFKKDPKERKTNESYFRERSRLLTEAWERFETNDTAIRMCSGLELNHPYFANDYYSEVMTLVHEHKEIFDEGIAKLSKNEAKLETSTPAGKPNASDNVMLPTQLSGLVRKLSAQMGAMDRLLSRQVDSSNQPHEYYRETLNCIKQLWARIEDTNGTMWEYVENPEETGHDIRRYIDLEEKVQQLIISLSVKIAPQGHQTQ